MTMASEYRYGTPALPIPQSNTLVITAREDPRQLSVELHRPHIVSMTCEREHALLGLVVPDLDSMVISSTDKHGLCIMKCDTSNWTIMVFELIDESLGSVIEQID